MNFNKKEIYSQVHLDAATFLLEKLDLHVLKNPMKRMIVSSVDWRKAHP